MTINTIKINKPELGGFYENNPNFDIFRFEFHNQAELAQLENRLEAAGIAKEKIAGTVDELKAHQRLLNLHPDPEVTNNLIKKGIVSANHLARIPRKTFVTEHAQSIGLDDSEAVNLHQRATAIRNKSMHVWASVNGAVASSYFSNSPMDTVSSQLKQTFQNLPSYQDMFGSLDYCGCQECRSIFGAAAYLVDLLRIIDEYVTKPNAETIAPEFFFTSRRPDIGKIDLTCAKTNTLVPYLQIVNERLLARAQQELGLNNPDQVVEQMAAALVYPQALPFNASLNQIYVLLDKVGVSFGSILSAWQAPSSTVAARSLGFSPERQKIVTTPLTSAAEVAPFYNVQDIALLRGVKTFTDKTWMSFVELLTLLNQDLSESEQKAGLQTNFFLNQGLQGKWVALHQEKDQPLSLENLEIAQLDQINRLLRLAATVGQPAQDVDWTLRCIQGGNTPAITDDALTALYQLIDAGTKLDLDMVTSSVLLGPIKTYGQGANGTGSAFDQLFNSPAVISKNAPYHPAGNPLNPGYADTPLAWIPGSAESADISAINRVLPGLGIGLGDANLLGVFLYGANDKKSTSKVTIQLTVQVLSVLYRHSLLSRALQFPISQYVLFLKLISLTDSTSPSVSEINKMADKGQWLRQTGLSVYQLDYIINGHPSVYVNPLYLPDKVDEWLRGLWTVVPVSSPTAEQDINAQVAVLFGMDNALADTLMSMAVAAVNLPAGVEKWSVAFLTPDSDGKTPKYANYVQAVLKWVSRWLVAAQALNLADAAWANIAAFPSVYQLPAKFNAISWDAVQSMQQIQQMMQHFGDLQQNLLSYIGLTAAEKTPSDNTLLVLQKATGWEPAEVKALLTGPLKNETVIPRQLADLQTCFDLMGKLGANPEFIASITAIADLPALNNWPTYTQTAAAVMAKTATVYGSQWDDIWNQLSGNIALSLRDALLALVLSQLNAKDSTIKTARNVYEFLLTDVEMGASTTISYIKEALNAAQLYLQRCRLQLEPGVLDMTHIQDAWWEWMMNYRVWEANRKIFVYPENYLIPNLRKNATPQFTALVQALQQSDINKAYVGSAFTAYINGFAEVAQLKTVDAYRTRINDTDTLYLLARTKTGPYTYYYCYQAENMPWTSWEKIDLSVNSPNGTLVYAFSRPFLFWNEIKKNNTSAVSGESGNVKTNNSLTYTVSVMYSFLNQEGKWVQPQTLVDQDVVSFQADDSRNIALKDADIFAGLFAMDSVAWNKVFAFSVNAQNYVTAQRYPAEAERLVVIYGPNMLNTGSLVDAGSSSPTNDPNAGSFWLNLHNRTEDHNRMVTGQLSGNVSLNPVSVLNLSLEKDVLLQRQELLLFDPYQAKTPLSSIRAEMQSSGDAMQISRSGQPVTDNRNVLGNVGLTLGSNAVPVDGDAFIDTGISQEQSIKIFDALKSAGIIDDGGIVQSSQMVTLNLYEVLAGITVYNEFTPAQYSAVLQVLFEHMDSTKLFSSASGSQAKVVPVGTQPGWFMFFVSDEIFLLSPKPTDGQKPLFSSFAEGLKIGDPLIEPTSFIIGEETSAEKIDSELSKTIFDTLRKFSVINDFGRIIPQNTTLSNLEFLLSEITQDKKVVLFIYLTLINAPIIFKDAFIFDNITFDISEKIYTALEKFSIIGLSGRIYEENITSHNVLIALGNLEIGGSLSQNQIVKIYRTLARAPKAIALSYSNEGSAANLTKTSDFVFDVTRLTTGAVNKISRALFVGGVDSLLNLKTQDIPVVPVLPFERFSPSTTNLNWPGALDATQVDFDGLYGLYFWEIFYHIPSLVAYSLNSNQQFQDAQAWLQYIFNPTITEQFVTIDAIVNETRQEISQQQAKEIIAQLQSHSIGEPAAPILSVEGRVNPNFTATTDLGFLQAAGKTLTAEQVLMVRNILLNYQLHAPSSHFWRFRPFRNHTLQSLQEMLSDRNPAVKVYNDDPFDPFAIARLRIGAFEKSTLMQYIDNLIAWGDQLFIQDTWESITAAYMLYVYAYDLLGPKPEQVGECAGSNTVLNFNQIKEKYPDGIPQFLIDLEHFIPDGSAADNPMMGHAFNDLYVYFCVPENTDLISRWDTVIDRMYKINHSMNIDGVFRTLALFEPPLNPLDLVRAAAAANNVQNSATSTPQLSPYRYSAALSLAQSLCETLISVGNNFLAVLEKADAEGLALLRQHQEGQILDMTIQIKQDRIDELRATIQSLAATQGSAKYRLQYYTDLINNGLSTYEQTSLSATEAALAFNILGSISKTAAAIAYTIPQVGSPFAMTYGGIQVGSSLSAASAALEIGSEISSFIAQQAATMGGYERRSQEWGLQKQLAQADVDSITQQIAAANLQLQSAHQDLAIQKKSIDQNKAVEAYLKDKFTNQDLYQWMVGRLSAAYFQTYALAMQTARQAEAAYQFDADSDKTFLSFNYWDSLHKGLTAGEGLRLALDRMNTAYRTGDVRRFEIEKTISLAMLAPDQLLALKITGKCSFSFSEALFDYDYPGQYARKIKTISISIPAIIGPYENIKAILTQTRNSVVTEGKIDVVNYLLGLSTQKPSAGLRQDWASNQSIAISRGMDDSGLFALDFQDPRYLPFENTGAVSDWTLSMPLETNRFDFEQMSDVIITLRYTALFDGGLQDSVKQALSKVPLTGGIYVDGGMQSCAWQAFLIDHDDKTTQSLTLNVNSAQLGSFKTLTFSEIILQLEVAEGITLSDAAAFLSLSVKNQPVQTPSFSKGKAVISNLNWNAKTLSSSWDFKFDLANPALAPLLSEGFIDGKKLLNLQVIVLYQAKVF